jgi:hypothetical protein
MKEQMKHAHGPTHNDEAQFLEEVQNLDREITTATWLVGLEVVPL